MTVFDCSALDPIREQAYRMWVRLETVITFINYLGWAYTTAEYSAGDLVLSSVVERTFQAVVYAC